MWARFSHFLSNIFRIHSRGHELPINHLKVQSLQWWNVNCEVSNYTLLGPHPLLVQISILFPYLYLLEVKVFNSHGHKQVVFVEMSRFGSWTMLHCYSLKRLIHHCLTPLVHHYILGLFIFTQGAESRLGI